MPILQPDPWRKTFFEHAACPPDVMIPTKDPDAYTLNPKHNWAYNKLLIAQKQSLPCGPHGVAPPHYPVFSKPIYNLRSMGAGSGVIQDAGDYQQALTPGFMWVQLLTGEHYSSDIAVVDGKPLWQCHTKGFPLAGGTFDYWHIESAAKPELQTYLADFIAEHFAGYTGMMNFETIGGKIIEMHLRFADQWPDLYGDWFVPALVDLYAHRHWPDHAMVEKDGYSVVLFADHASYRKPAAQHIDALAVRQGINSIQLSFHEGVDPHLHSMPPGGFRLAIINGWDLQACQQARRELAQVIQKTS